MVIPKKIHYFWFGKRPLPDKEKACIESWKNICPDYELILWNESNYDVFKTDFTRQAYEADKMAFVADYARLDVLYQHGGICLDTDVEIIKSLDRFLTDGAFAGFHYNRPQRKLVVNAGLCIASYPGNPLIKELRDDYDNRRFINADGTLNLTTCSVYQTAVLQKHGLKIENKKQTLKGIVIYPYEYFDPKDDFTGEIGIKQETHTIHHFHATWKSPADKERLELQWKYYKRFGKFSKAISTLAAYTKHYGYWGTAKRILSEVFKRKSEGFEIK